MDGLSLLQEAHAVGLTLAAESGRLVIRGPKCADAVARRLLAHKAELMALLDTDNALSELRRFVASRWQDRDWLRSWEHRLRDAKYADLDALRRVLGVIIDIAEKHHRRRSWVEFESTRKFLIRVASGQVWDDAKPIHDPHAWNIVPRAE